MSGFKFVNLTCPECGQTHEGLAWWDGIPCGPCSSARYAAELQHMNEGRTYRVDTIGGACPTQAEGKAADGRAFYFRARHGGWKLQVGQPHAPIDYMLSDVIAAGEDPTAGCMANEDVLAILDEAFGAQS